MRGNVWLVLLTTWGCSDGGGAATADAGPEGRVDATAGADARTGAPLTPLLQSDFATATGTTAMALEDGGLWAVYGTGGEVLANPGDLGFPAGMANVLRVSWSQGSGIWRVGPPFGPGLPALAVGSTRYYRYYFRQVQPDGTVDTQTHPFQDGGAGSQTNWTTQCFNNVGPGMWLLGHGFWDNPFPNDQFHLSTPLPKAHTYRLEHAIERVSDTTFRFDSRVFDEAVSTTTPIYDGDDFYAGGQPARGSMTAYFATQTLTFNDAANLDGFNAGVNDIEPTEPGDYAFEGGIAIVDDQGWIGPYGTVAGEP
ncbi:MAG: hypothetical protein KA297_10130 [Kofleriaceae bacterium]|jgi:hypothetical protein|nr:hypothetical protein [Kofleriaceae bacterium]